VQKPKVTREKQNKRNSESEKRIYSIQEKDKNDLSSNTI
jgi:hypothetical protein